jgi:hypothetical protein
MQSLIGDRFLKQFFGGRLRQRRSNPASEAMTLPASEEEEALPPGGSTAKGNPPDTDATVETGQAGQVGQLAVPDNPSDQPTTEAYPLVAGVSRE